MTEADKMFELLEMLEDLTKSHKRLEEAFRAFLADSDSYYARGEALTILDRTES